MNFWITWLKDTLHSLIVIIIFAAIVGSVMGVVNGAMGIMYDDAIDRTYRKVLKEHPQIVQVSGTGVFDAVNSLRISNGLEPFKLDLCLDDAAEVKASHMEDHHYWGHEYENELTNDKVNVGFDYAMGECNKEKVAEVLAKGQITSDDVAQAWLQSEGHRQYILHKDLRYAGVAVIVRRYQGHMETLIVMEMSIK